mmetsp:Transcript_37529/g.87561  ORF Transcript_37529/g.87561 Transcript_37529/m.87561 type:complete len:291 (+) Transcript_37529:1539-2411(+)
MPGRHGVQAAARGPGPAAARPRGAASPPLPLPGAVRHRLQPHDLRSPLARGAPTGLRPDHLRPGEGAAQHAAESARRAARSGGVGGQPHALRDRRQADADRAGAHGQCQRPHAEASPRPAKHHLPRDAGPDALRARPRPAVELGHDGGPGGRVGGLFRRPCLPARIQALGRRAAERVPRGRRLAAGSSRGAALTHRPRHAVTGPGPGRRTPCGRPGCGAGPRASRPRCPAASRTGRPSPAPAAARGPPAAPGRRRCRRRRAAAPGRRGRSRCAARSHRAPGRPSAACRRG